MYKYEEERPWVLTDDGQRQLLKLLSWVEQYLQSAGAFRMDKALSGAEISSSEFKRIALIDRLVELGKIKEVPGQAFCMIQHRVYISTRLY